MNKVATFFAALLLSYVAHTEVLTLEQALATARTANWDLKAIEGKYIQSQAQVYKTLSAYLPKISVGGNYTRNSKEIKQPMPPSEERMKRAVLTPLKSYGAQAQITQMLISPWLILQLTNLNKYSEMTRLNKEQARRDILFTIAQLYYTAASSKEAVSMQKHLLDTRTAHEKNVELRFEQRLVVKAELLSAQIEKTQNEQDLVMAQNTHEAAKLSLAAMLSRDADFDVTAPPPPYRPNGDQLSLSSINTNRFDVKAAILHSELADRVRGNYFLKYLPDLSLQLQYRGTDPAGVSGEKHMFSLTLNLNWSIFDGGLREAEFFENSGKALEAKAGAAIRDLNAHKDIESAKLNLSSAEANREKAIKQVELAREQFRLVQASHKEGAATHLEFLKASNTLASAEIALITQNLNVNLAAVKLQHELGIFE